MRARRAQGSALWDPLQSTNESAQIARSGDCATIAGAHLQATRAPRLNLDIGLATLDLKTYAFHVRRA
jgi:hypothetical protein